MEPSVKKYHIIYLQALDYPKNSKSYTITSHNHDNIKFPSGTNKIYLS